MTVLCFARSLELLKEKSSPLFTNKFHCRRCTSEASDRSRSRDGPYTSLGTDQGNFRTDGARRGLLGFLSFSPIQSGHNNKKRKEQKKRREEKEVQEEVRRRRRGHISHVAIVFLVLCVFTLHLVLTRLASIRRLARAGSTAGLSFPGDAFVSPNMEEELRDLARNNGWNRVYMVRNQWGESYVELGIFTEPSFFRISSASPPPTSPPARPPARRTATSTATATSTRMTTAGSGSTGLTPQTTSTHP